MSAARNLVVIEGLDGSGKSTVAQTTAVALSEAHRNSRIGVADSTGLYTFLAGNLVGHRYSGVVDLEPGGEDGNIKTALKLGMFTLARKFVDSQGLRQHDVLLSVRDPNRVDPAVYSAIYSPNTIGRLSPLARLSLFDTLTLSSYPDMVIQLEVEPTKVKLDTGARTIADPHESDERLHAAARELPLVLGAFGKLFGKPVHEVEALTYNTFDNVAELVEPYVELSQRAA